MIAKFIIVWNQSFRWGHCRRRVVCGNGLPGSYRVPRERSVVSKLAFADEDGVFDSFDLPGGPLLRGFGASTVATQISAPMLRPSRKNGTESPGVASSLFLVMNEFAYHLANAWHLYTLLIVVTVISLIELVQAAQSKLTNSNPTARDPSSAHISYVLTITIFLATAWSVDGLKVLNNSNPVRTAHAELAAYASGEYLQGKLDRLTVQIESFRDRYLDLGNDGDVPNELITLLNASTSNVILIDLQPWLIAESDEYSVVRKTIEFVAERVSVTRYIVIDSQDPCDLSILPSMVLGIPANYREVAIERTEFEARAGTERSRELADNFLAVADNRIVALASSQSQIDGGLSKLQLWWGDGGSAGATQLYNLGAEYRRLATSIHARGRGREVKCGAGS